MTPRIPRACSSAIIPVRALIKVNMPTWGEKKTLFVHTKNESMCAVEKAKNPRKANENHDLFSKSDANRQKQLASKEPPMRD